jgi:peptidoglycan/xylan/chitin deacetylase (PgdA/CDA1 family)
MRERLRLRPERLRLRRYRKHARRPIVLLYHRVGATSPDPQLLSVSEKHFAEHVQLLSQSFVPTRLADVVTAAGDGRAPAGAVALAFDDGYADNLLAAKPLLERSGVPATVFVASGYVRDTEPFWWDELERLVLRPGRLPSVLTLPVGDEELSWNLREDAEYSPACAAERNGWTVLDATEPGERQRVYRALCDRLRVLDYPERSRALQRLHSVAEPEVAADELAHPLTVGEVEQLADGDVVEVGAHSVTHPSLARLPLDRQRQEVRTSKRHLEEIVGRPVASFAYPFGGYDDFDHETVRVVQEAGFERACANLPGRLSQCTDPFRIPRLVVRDWSGDELARRLVAPMP